MSAFPTQPFWDFVQLVHFGQLLRDHGLTAYDWYWAQFNPGLPVVLSVLFRIFVGNDVAVARTATAVATGLVPLLPWFLWRGVLERRIRLLAGVLLALWPGQVLFSGAIAQDNWVLLPAIALASLAVRRLCDSTDGGHSIASALLFGGAIAVRQEMALVLLPVAVAAAFSQESWRRKAPAFASTVLGAMLVLAAQRDVATGRFSIASEHGALGLFGSFVPGASGPGWIDARAYAEALEPGTTRAKLFGDPKTLVRLTLREAARRPLFHALRIATWPARLAASSDAENLFWSVAAPRALPASRQPAGARFAEAWRPLLRVELAVISGLFAAAVLLGAFRRDATVLVVASAVVLKLLVHAVVSPLARLAVPAVALELLTIAAAARIWRASERRLRFAAAFCAAATAGLLYFGVPPLQDWITRHDDSVLPGVRVFSLRAGPICVVRCDVESGHVVGIAPTWVRLRAGAGDGASLRCSLPVLGDRGRIRARATDLAAGEVSAEIRREDGEAAVARLSDDGVELDGSLVVRLRPSPSANPSPSQTAEATILFDDNTPDANRP